ncbi:MAG TPA: phage major capsid protein [Planctomycetota bacterium]|nr:phage major capsid protein [Planctomycetota bacterium]
MKTTHPGYRLPTIAHTTPRLYAGLRNTTDRIAAYRCGVWFASMLGAPWAQRAAAEMEFNAIQSEGTNTAGGYLVPDEVIDQIVTIRERYGVFRKHARIIPTKSDHTSVPRRVSGLTAYAAAEGAAGTESTAGLSNIGITPKKWIVLTAATKELDEDAISNFGDWLIGEIAYAFAKAEDEAGFVGDGGSTYNGILGLKGALQAGCIQTQGTGNTWGAITITDINNMMAKVIDLDSVRDPAFYCSKAFFHGVLERVAHAAGVECGLIVVNGEVMYHYSGYPVRFTHSMPRSTAVSTICCFFGDLAVTSLLADRRAVTITKSTDAVINGRSLFETDELGIRGTERVDIVNHEVGTASACGSMAALQTGS